MSVVLAFFVAFIINIFCLLGFVIAVANHKKILMGIFLSLIIILIGVCVFFGYVDKKLEKSPLEDKDIVSIELIDLNNKAVRIGEDVKDKEHYINIEEIEGIENINTYLVTYKLHYGRFTKVKHKLKIEVR